MRMSQREAAMAFTRLAEADDVIARALIEERGYVGAWETIEGYMRHGRAPREYRTGCARWAPRFDERLFEADAAQLEHLGASFTYPGDAAWPQAFKLLGPARPLGLWYLGPHEALDMPAISIIGSRDCTEYGRTLARDFAFELASLGFTIASGGAFGIDGAAHEGTLAAHSNQGAGAPVVIFANGLGSYYPKAHMPLFEAIAEVGGVLATEAPPGATPQRHRFLSRNRLIAALGLATLVIEAPYRSGALSTAHHALSIGRDVGAIPGPVSSPHSAGCHRLIREGGVLIRSVRDVLELAGNSTDGTARLFGLADGCPASLSGEGDAGGDGQGGSSGFAREGGSSGLDAEGNVGGTRSGEHHPLAVRVREGLSPRRPQSVSEVASAAGVSVREA